MMITVYCRIAHGSLIVDSAQAITAAATDF